MDFEQAFRTMGIPPRRYVLRVGVPAVLGGILLAAATPFAFGALLPPWAVLVIPAAIVLFAVVGVVMYPLSAVDRKRMEIDNALPFFMTHLGVLSTSNMPRTEVIRMLSERREYGALADELRRIHGLVVDWKMALPEACRFAGASTPSQILADFLERLAHAMETGQDFQAFMEAEQAVVMKEYATVYETAIYQVESWKDIYMSTIMSGAFLAIFAIITPILTGSNPEGMLLGVLGFIVFMEFLLAFLLRMRTPADQLWHKMPILTPERRRLRKFLLYSGLGALVLTVTLVFYTPLPTGLALAAGVTPLAVGGRQYHLAEERVKRREDNYAAFIRSLGSSLAAKGGSVREVMKQVRGHNFGPLTSIVDNLYSRLTWRLDDGAAWDWFAAESGSHLVNSFTEMFIEGIKSGGGADKVGNIISANVVRILNLRKSRYSTAGTFRGTLFGLTGSMAFVLFLGVGILGVLGDIFELSAGQGEVDAELQPFQVDFDVDMDLVRDSVLLLLVIHSFLAASMLKMVDGGSIPAGLSSLVVLTWISVVLATISDVVLPRVFNL